MDLLKRHLAPISEEAWGEIDDMARSVIRTHTTARRVLDGDALVRFKLER